MCLAGHGLWNRGPYDLAGSAALFGPEVRSSPEEGGGGAGLIVSQAGCPDLWRFGGGTC